MRIRILDLRRDMVTRINLICIILFVLIILSSGITSSLAGVDGFWKINGFGADSMSLTRVGNHVYGTYNTHQGQGTIDGIIDTQSVWRGTWNEPFNDDWGYFLAAFSNDTSLLCGSWKYAYDDCEPYWYRNYIGGWDGYFQGEKSQGNASISG